MSRQEQQPKNRKVSDDLWTTKPLELDGGIKKGDAGTVCACTAAYKAKH